jgi:hypothetical protein
MVASISLRRISSATPAIPAMPHTVFFSRGWGVAVTTGYHIRQMELVSLSATVIAVRDPR